MHTTGSYTVFPFRVFSSEHWFITWTTFSIKAAKTKSTKEECAPSVETHCFRSLDLSNESGILNLRTKDLLTYDLLLFVRIPQIQGIIGKRMSNYGALKGTGFNPQNPLQVLLRLHRDVPKHSPATAVQVRCWLIHVAHKTLPVWRTCRGVYASTSLANLCYIQDQLESAHSSLLVPPRWGLPKTPTISTLRERYSDCFIIIITIVADLINQGRETILLYSKKLLYLRGLQPFSLLNSCKQWEDLVINWLNLKKWTNSLLWEILPWSQANGAADRLRELDTEVN